LQALPGSAARQRITWCEIRGDTIAHGFRQEAAYADLLVLGQPASQEGAGGAPADLLIAALFDSGRPALVLPRKLASHAVPRRVLVAWNASPQAARALTGALPLLRLADKVDVAVWSHAPDASPFARMDLTGYLHRHGIAAQMHRFDASPHVTTEINRFAASSKAELIVMGCYGHSRARERVFGGASRSALESMAVPVLMSH
jgi:nucleotide-binding universal stress UspA family protein